ncbi:hypothetical protein BE11_24310 [Sorangium cellulosum]|nr:hypothetical protein BE11_24310 [Sorangium cellulosum]
MARAEALSRVLEAQREALSACAEALSVPARTPLEGTAGFEMQESLLDQGRAISLDAVHLRLKGDVELLFFHQIASPNSSGGINDYRGRTRRLAYDVDPVFMVGGRAMITYDFEHVRDAARLNAGFKTDRLFSSGGDIRYDSSLGKLIGLNGLASDVFDIGADLVGLRTSLKVARFTSGDVAEIAVDPATGRDAGVVASAPFQLLVRQIDVGFDVTKLFPDAADDLYLEELLAGFRYMDYKLPRIFYELREREPGKGDIYLFERQSPAQSVTSRFYQGGFSLRMGNGEWPRLAPFGDIGLYGGAGPVRYAFSGDPSVPGGEREVDEATMIALSGNLSVGLRLRLTSYLSRLRLLTELSYNVEAVGQGIVSGVHATRRGDETTYTIGRKIDIGGFDMFHGPRLPISGSTTAVPAAGRGARRVQPQERPSSIQILDASRSPWLNCTARTSMTPTSSLSGDVCPGSRPRRAAGGRQRDRHDERITAPSFPGPYPAIVVGGPTTTSSRVQACDLVV